MENSKDLLRPIIIGVAGALTSGKDILRDKLVKSMKDYKVSVLSLEYYRKEPDEILTLKHEELAYYKEGPKSYDFNKLIHDLDDLKNGKSIKIKEKNGEEKIIESQPLILIEGILTLYDQKIRNIIDIKLFIDVDLDSCLINSLNDAMRAGRFDLEKNMQLFSQVQKPIYVKYLAPTKKYADIILPQMLEDSVFNDILCEYLNNQMSKVSGGDYHYIFTSDNEIIDSKWKYSDQQILVIKDSFSINFLKQVFIDVITKEEDEFIVDKIQDKLMNFLFDSLSCYFREKKMSRNNPMPKVDLIITESDKDNYTSHNWKNVKKVFIYKTIIMSQKDMEIPVYISKMNPKCNIVLSSIFLSPKFADFLLSNKLDTVLLNTLFFSDFLGKFESYIRFNNKTFEPEVLSQKFKSLAANFVDISEFDDNNDNKDDKDDNDDDELGLGVANE